jgi:hypothetical protein
VRRVDHQKVVKAIPKQWLVQNAMVKNCTHFGSVPAQPKAVHGFVWWTLNRRSEKTVQSEPLRFGVYRFNLHPNVSDIC